MSKKLHMKITTLLIAFVMVASAFTMPVIADEKTVAMPDYSKAVSALQAFGILVDEAADPAAEVTRGDFVTAITRFFGIELSENYSAQTKFSDVLPEDKLFTAVSVATDLGLISGYGDGTFRPEEPITKTQAVKIIVTLLGYEPAADAYGGYPSGYLMVGTKVDLTDGISTTEGVCLWGEAAQMLYNALEVELMENTKYPDAQYHVVKDSNILNSWLHIHKIEGIVQANDITSIDQAEGVTEGRVKIAGSLFEEGTTCASKLLGYYVEAYYKENTTTRNQLLFIYKDSDFELEQISATDIESADLSEITYFNEAKDKTDKYNISRAAVIYNNKWIPKDNTAKALLKPAEGNLKFLDNNSDGVIDVVFVEEHTVYFVDNVYSVNHTITDKYSNNRLVLDPDDSELEYEIIKDGNPIDFSEIASNNVLSVIQSPVADGKKFIQVFVGTERFSGAITELSDKTIYIDGVEYEIFDSVRNEIQKLDLLDKSLFYLTYDNKIAGYGTVVTSGLAYGYVTAAGCIKQQSLGFENIATLKMFSLSEGKIVSYDTAAKISINGKRNSGVDGTPYTGRSLVEKFGQSDSFAHQLIQFQLNEKGLIIAVNFYDDCTNNGIGYDLDKFSLDYKWITTRWPGGTQAIYSSHYRYYKTINGGLFDNRFFSGSGTILKIPVNPDGSLVDEELIAIPTLEDDSTYYHLEVYDSDESNNAAVVIIRARDLASPSTTATHFTIDKVTSVIDEDGLAVKKIYGYYGSKYSEFIVSKDESSVLTSVSTLKRGDIITIALDARGEIVNILKLFTVAENPDASEFKMTSLGFDNQYFESGKFTQESFFRLNREHVTNHVRATRVSDSFLCAKFDQVSAVMPIAAKTPVIVYNEKADTLTLGSISDIVPDDPKQSIVTYTTWGVVARIYVINRINDYYPTWVGISYN